tara:strand:- start:1610 stop:1846 length:237 start_codon:yes stop_codon:yes gene_type:complete
LKKLINILRKTTFYGSLNNLRLVHLNRLLSQMKYLSRLDLHFCNRSNELKTPKGTIYKKELIEVPIVVSNEFSHDLRI